MESLLLRAFKPRGMALFGFPFRWQPPHLCGGRSASALRKESCSRLRALALVPQFVRKGSIASSHVELRDCHPSEARDPQFKWNPSCCEPSKQEGRRSSVLPFGGSLRIHTGEERFSAPKDVALAITRFSAGPAVRAERLNCL